MQAPSPKPTLFFYKRFLETKYLLILGFVLGMVLITFFILPRSGSINYTNWGWGFFSASFAFFFLYCFSFLIFWKNKYLNLNSFWKTLLVIFINIIIFIFFQTICMLQIYKIIILEPKIIFFIFFPLGTVVMFISISFSLKLFLDWKQQVLPFRKHQKKEVKLNKVSLT